MVVLISLHHGATNMSVVHMLLQLFHLLLFCGEDPIFNVPGVKVNDHDVAFLFQRSTKTEICRNEAHHLFLLYFSLAYG